MLWALHCEAGFRQGLARTLSHPPYKKKGGEVMTDTLARVTTVLPTKTRHGITIEATYLLRLPRTRLSRPRPPTAKWVAGLVAHGPLLTPLSYSGSSFPADSAKPVPLAVVSLDSR
jgi:hypothetical protein